MSLPRCPRCNGKIVHKSLDDGKIRIRTSCLVLSKAGTAAICKKCGAEVPVDIRIGDSISKAFSHTPRLVVRKCIDSKNTGP